jgi:hypothetical protein
MERRLRLLRGHSLVSPFLFVFAVSRFCTTCAEAGQTHQQDPLKDGFRYPELFVLDSLAEELEKI